MRRNNILTLSLNNDEESGIAPNVYTSASQSLLGVQVSNQNPTLHFIASLAVFYVAYIEK